MDIHPEIRFTKPTPRCPNPERWHATDDQSTELEVTNLVAAFVHALQPDYVIETGTFIGSTARMIGQCLELNGQGELHSIELNPEAARVARLNTEDLPNVHIHEMSSMDFIPDTLIRDRDRDDYFDTDRPAFDLITGHIGFAWFDSLVTLRVPEFHRYRPYMQAGTICGFHDTAPHHGTWSHELNDIPGTRTIHLPTPRGVTFLEVL